MIVVFLVLAAMLTHLAAMFLGAVLYVWGVSKMERAARQRAKIPSNPFEGIGRCIGEPISRGKTGFSAAELVAGGSKMASVGVPLSQSPAKNSDPDCERKEKDFLENRLRG